MLTDLFAGRIDGIHRIDFDSLYKAVRQPGVLTANYGPDWSGIITLLVGKTAICNN
jgi:hypothetical protein